jgi:ParB family transcriptional regulator, chromosome partitioning protein
MTTTLQEIPPDLISPNPENPRMYFREAGLNKLADSVEEAGGVLVPVYVYEDPNNNGRYILIDGERRWRVALNLGLDTIPALVRDSEPDPAKNIVEMFNIHKVREDWEEMPTARALLEVMNRTGTEDPDELKNLTGISKEQIARFKLILSLPEPYQKMIEDGDIPMNFFVELDRNVIRPLQRSRHELAATYDDEALRQAFISKREQGALPDLIDLRKVKPIISRAVLDAGSADNPSELDDYLRRLFDDGETTVDEIYDASVAVAIEADELRHQVELLPKQFERLLQAAEGEDREAVLQTLRGTRDALSALVDQYSHQAA